MMAMWVVNNQQFLFDSQDEATQEYVMRIVGRESFEYFQRAGMGEEEVSPEAARAIADIIQQQGGNMSDADITQLTEAGKLPKYPIIENPNEKNPDNYKIKAKLRVSDMGDEAELSMVPEDLEGNYDYVADVQSMASGALQDVMQGRQQVLETIQNPQLMQMLAAEGKKVKISDLLISIWDGLNLEGERYIEDLSPQQGVQGQPQAGAGMPGMQGSMPPGAQGMPMQPQPGSIQDVNSILQQGSQALQTQPQLNGIPSV